MIAGANDRKIKENLDWVNENVEDLRIPEKFEVVAPIHDETDPPPSRKQRMISLEVKLNLAPFYQNPQTTAFCKLLDIDVSKMPR